MTCQKWSSLCLLIVLSQWTYSQNLSSIPSTPAPQHDPTQPFYTTGPGKAEETGRLELQSTLVGKTRRIALINDTFVQIGDTIGTAKVIAISEGSVVLLDSGHTETLYLFANDIRK